MKNTKTGSTIWLVALFLLSPISFRESAGAAVNGNKVKPDAFIVDHPTLINLAFEWVEVSYRKRSETQWKLGLPLLRLHGERIYQNQGVFDVISPNMFAGSILDLAPDTAYEARFCDVRSRWIPGAK